MNLIYLLTPFSAWICAGLLKFFINSVREHKLAFNLIGYGGFPSNHSTIISSAVVQVAIQEGISNPAFGVGIAAAFIIMLDAVSLRREVGRHARILNKLSHDSEILRVRMGHKPYEIVAGIILGGIVAYTLNLILQ